MSRGGWCILIAVVGIALGYPIEDAAYGQAGPGERAEQTQAETEPSNLAAIENGLNRIASEIEAARSEPQTETGQTQAERDLAAQEGMWTWAKFAAFVGAVMAVLTLIGLILIWQTLESTKEAARHAKTMADEAVKATKAAVLAAEASDRSADVATRTLEHAREASDFELRPWLSISAQLGSPVTIDERGITFSADITVTNVGKSVAQQVWVTAKAVALVDARTADEFFAECREKDIRKDLNNLLVPNEKTEVHHFLMVTPKELDGTSIPDMAFPGIYVSAVYMTLKGGRVLQTGRSFNLVRAGERGAMAFKRQFGETPQNQAAITEYPLGGDYVA